MEHEHKRKIRQRSKSSGSISVPPKHQKVGEADSIQRKRIETQQAMRPLLSTSVRIQRKSISPIFQAITLQREEEKYITSERQSIQRAIESLGEIPKHNIGRALQRQLMSETPLPTIKNPRTVEDLVTVMRQRAADLDGKSLGERDQMHFNTLQRQVAANINQAYRKDRQSSEARNTQYGEMLASLHDHPKSQQVSNAVLTMIPKSDQPKLQRALDEALQRKQEQDELDQKALELHALQKKKAELKEEQKKPVFERIQAKKGGGQALSKSVRKHLEQGLNQDLSKVRIHDNAEANKLAKSVNAIAFTSGQDIFFQSGKYDPNSQTGLELLAHEVTHTVQQSKGQVAKGIDPDAGLEQEAKEMGKKLAMSFPLGKMDEDATESLQHPISQVTNMASGLQRKAEQGSGSEPGSLLQSLASVAPSEAISALNQAEADSPAALKSQRDSAEAELPEIPTPTGEEAQADKDEKKPEEMVAEQANESSAQSPEHQPKKLAASDMAPAPSNTETAISSKALVPEAPPAPAPTPTVLKGKGASKGTSNDKETDAEAKNSDPEMAQSASQALQEISLPSDQIPTKAEEQPQVDLSGEANPDQMETEQSAAQVDVDESLSETQNQIHESRGENNIVPEVDSEALKAEFELQQPEADTGEAIEPPQISDEVLASLDTDATSALQEKVGAEQTKYEEGKAQYDTDRTAAHDQAKEEMQTLEEEALSKQQSARDDVQQEAADARADWQTGIEEIELEFQQQADQSRTEHQLKIDSEAQSGNEKAREHIRQAEEKAEVEKQRAENEVTNKKKAAEQESGGFFGWVKSAAEALIDGVKTAVNAIYDTLRTIVKEIFEAAKALALGVIDLARQAIILWIKAHVAALKLLVTAALNKFPELRDRIHEKIDSAVKLGTTIINQIIDGLKKAVTVVIDFLAKTVDSLLGLIQDIYNAVFTVIKMIISGELVELMQKVGQLVAAAKTAPEQFETAAYEELLGGNLDNPLAGPELEKAYEMGLLGDNMPTTTSENATLPSEQVSDDLSDAEAMSGEIPQPPYTNENVGVDQVASGVTLSRELSSEVLDKTGGGDGEVAFGESNDSNRSLESMLGTEQGGETQEAALDQQKQTDQQPDGLTPKQRAEVKWAMMKEGLDKWWNENWAYVLAGGVIGVVGLIVGSILSGGAVLAAVGFILKVIGPLFAGVLAVQLGGHLRDFFQKGWDGDLQGGGKSLAKALAVGAIEVVTLLTMKVGSVAMKGAKATTAAVSRGGRALSRSGGRKVAAAGCQLTQGMKSGAGFFSKRGGQATKADDTLLRRDVLEYSRRRKLKTDKELPSDAKIPYDSILRGSTPADFIKHAKTYLNKQLPLPKGVKVKSVPDASEAEKISKRWMSRIEKEMRKNDMPKKEARKRAEQRSRIDVTSKGVFFAHTREILIMPETIAKMSGSLQDRLYAFKTIAHEWFHAARKSPKRVNAFEEGAADVFSERMIRGSTKTEMPLQHTYEELAEGVELLAKRFGDDFLKKSRSAVDQKEYLRKLFKEHGYSDEAIKKVINGIQNMNMTSQYNVWLRSVKDMLNERR